MLLPAGFIQQRRPVLLEEFQPLLHGFDHAARRDGRAGELVKHAAVFFHCPFVRRRIAQPFTLKRMNPVAFGRIDLVAQTRCFRVLDDAYSEYFAFARHAHDTHQRTGITMADHAIHHGIDLARMARAIHQHIALLARQGNRILEQVVVVVTRQHLGQGLLEVGRFRGLDVGCGQMGSNGQCRTGEQRRSTKQKSLIKQFAA